MKSNPSKNKNSNIRSILLASILILEISGLVYWFLGNYSSTPFVIANPVVVNGSDHVSFAQHSPKDKNAALAFTQLRYIEKNFVTPAIKKKFQVKYEICHVGELTSETIQQLESWLVNTKVRDLSALIKNEMSFGSEWSKRVGRFFSGWSDIPFFQGYPCKPMCLSTMTHTDHVMLVDDDLCFLANPLELLLSDEYKEYGNVLFRDRVEYGNEFVPFIYQVFIPEFVVKYIHNKDPYYVRKSIELRQHILNNIQQINETDWVGESALVLMNARKLEEALKILQHIHKPNIRNQIYSKSWGDKETFWLSVVLSGHTPFFSPFGMQILGLKRNEEMCQEYFVLVQYLSTGQFKGTNILYVNGLGIENILSAHPKRLKALRSRYKYVSFPDPQLGHQVGLCRPFTQCRKFDDAVFDVAIKELNNYSYIFHSSVVNTSSSA
ncbi:hypothetical protein RFI_06548 [Reticulomyxa filosa]|uniref:Uncharacterized protein n=1 Tax=Reticulomyxa filosa TaxID=46433 RepID=X6NXM1_RETFI|nr:hypothetical protein RFI_06548 [Reticulomyxa filosa]|eukprot:ETO30569.1 hypothetical protein RFI_06548 [Reticulomyxa filosa]